MSRPLGTGDHSSGCSDGPWEREITVVAALMTIAKGVPLALRKIYYIYNKLCLGPP